jgi:hypothetical protein
MTWLARLKNVATPPEAIPTKPTKGGFVGFVGTPPGLSLVSSGIPLPDSTTESRPSPARESYERIPEADPDAGEPWTGQEPDPQDLAHVRLIGMGLDDPEAAKLAEWMVLRQEHGEDQIVCYECKHFRPNRKRCGNHIKAEMPQELGTDLATKPQRCPGFADLPQRFSSS